MSDESRALRAIAAAAKRAGASSDDLQLVARMLLEPLGLARLPTSRYSEHQKATR